ncbi:hypothetical protein EL84_22760 [Paenibacillus sp. VT-400]|uniref:DUF4832 domain-containing protein n=1 Tax=Paenibacillus sp. VT-400 TaxID=1495853 RepID=UPI00064B156A|nr:DUF4832 domain-containing protein [Paenibacillus sp. VT-400]KLU54935.1 hypothetical protein EL84_22760 [Paenibacillus sp. VT-400]
MKRKLLKPMAMILTLGLFIGGPLAVMFPKTSAAAGTITVNLTETQEAFKNPFKGFRPTRFMNDTKFPNHEYGTVFKHYIKYTDLENASSDSVQKIMDWSNAAWAGIESQNKKVIPRVLIVYPNEGEFWPQGVPSGDVATRWTTNILKDRLAAFIQKLGQAWDSDPRVAYVELGLWGNWGEHHIYPDQLADETDRIPLSFQTALGDAAEQAFQNKKVQVRYPDTFQNYDFGLLWDSFALIDDLEGGEGIVARDSWRTQVNGGEVAYDWGQKHIQPGDSPDDTLSDIRHRNYVIDWIKKTHTTSLGWIDLYDAKNSAVSQGAALMQKELGYRFVINQATFSENVQPGEKMKVSFQVVNKGSAPFYYKWPVEASLLRSDRSVAWKGIFNNEDIRNWMPGDDWNSSTRQYDQTPSDQQVSGEFDIPSNLPAGTYTLALSILDPYGNRPSARFANTNYYTGGRTPIGKVGIGMDPANQNIGPFDSLKSENTLSYSLTQTPYDGGYSSGTSSLLLDEFKDLMSWPGSNGISKWTGANGFVNDAGVIESGALKLQYNNNGWFGSDIKQNIENYSKMVIKIKGAHGGEQHHMQLSIGGVSQTLAAFSGDTVTTSFKEVEIDLAAKGIDRSSPGQLTMTFWHGGNSTIWIDEIRFE